jgi:hypothetical protein
MAYKFDRYHRDYLYWIYPVIILGLTIFAIKRDNQNTESATSPDSDLKADSSMTISIQDRMPGSHRMTENTDSTFRFFAAIK